MATAWIVRRESAAREDFGLNAFGGANQGAVLRRMNERVGIHAANGIGVGAELATGSNGALCCVGSGVLSRDVLGGI